MSLFFMTERSIAKFLEPFPRFRAIVKNVYLRLNYVFQKEVPSCEVSKGTFLKETVKTDRTLRPIKEYFFGYYDKNPWSLDMKFMLMHQVRSDGKVNVLIIDENGGSRVIGSSSAWNWQQGAMTQWIPGRPISVIYNDIDGSNLVSIIVDVESGKKKTIPIPFQSIDPTGLKALTLNYRRLYALRSEYGYAADVRNFSHDMPLEKDGIWLVDIERGTNKLILSLKDLIEFKKEESMEGAFHKVNHIIYSPNGNRFIFMHRWITTHGKISRLYMYDIKTARLEILLDGRMVSHYSWKDNDSIITWTRSVETGDRYFLLDVNTLQKSIVGDGVFDKLGDGHPSFSPDGRYIISDTYPDKARRRHLLLYDYPTGQISDIAQFHAPWKYDGNNRCDLHPRWSPDGKNISFDSTHEGFRNSYILNVSKLLKR